MTAPLMVYLEKAKYLAVASLNNILLKEIDTLKTKGKLSSHITDIAALTSSYDGSILVTASNSSVFNVWTYKDQNYHLKFKIQKLDLNKGLAWSPSHPGYYSVEDSDKYFMIQTHEKNTRYPWDQLLKYRDQYRKKQLFSE
ncbi:hypothetical protein [Spartinivicinus ruber]|uniref:hypothetical protein n=1 Tax=Spartinivicinus ruber TaxID=2683272 RepID=UPI0013D50FA7|nr:hypothetical protein [Spartinivicinus ruber]